MNLFSLIMLLLVVILGTVGQLSLKYTFSISTKKNQESAATKKLIYSPYFWIWFVCYGVMTILWLVVLRNVPLSQAFPALGLTFALVPLASCYFLGEKVFFTQWLGIAVIVAGVTLIAQT